MKSLLVWIIFWFILPILKLTTVISWSWWVCFTPLLSSLIVLLAAGMISAKCPYEIESKDRY